MASTYGVRPITAALLLVASDVDFPGDSWEKAKTQTEVSGSSSVPQKLLSLYLNQCLDYLFEIGVKMKLAGIPTVLNN